MTDRKQYVVVYAPSENGNLPMVLKGKPDFLKGVLNLPGGKVEPGETAVEAAVRELDEETGLPQLTPALHVGTIFGNSSDIYVVRVEVAEAEIRPSEGETEAFSWHNQREVCLHPSLMPNLRLVVPLCCAGALGWTVYDWTGDWRGVYHRVQLQLIDNQCLEVRLPGLAYYKEP